MEYVILMFPDLSDADQKLLAQRTLARMKAINKKKHKECAKKDSALEAGGLEEVKTEEMDVDTKEPAMVSVQGSNVVLDLTDDAMSKKVKKKKAKKSESSRDQCQYCGDTISAKGSGSHLRSCEQKYRKFLAVQEKKRAKAQRNNTNRQ